MNRGKYLLSSMSMLVIISLSLGCRLGSMLATQGVTPALITPIPIQAPRQSMSTQPGPLQTETRRSKSPVVRGFPDTWDEIHIFNDQLGSRMSEAQVEFAASHYAGTQKMERSEAERLRAYNPDLIILHYRLGLGLGYRTIEGDCDPTGEWIHLIEGDEWAQEWPGESMVADDWFYHWPVGNRSRIMNCDWGWYLMNLENQGWRTYWTKEVLRQVLAIDADGVFADSFSVPNYLGAERFKPNLPLSDPGFESEWAEDLEAFIAYLQESDLQNYYFVPNVGSWVTSRDSTDYSDVDGVMVEGFAEWGMGQYFELSDWQLQMDRILNLVQQDKVILAQQYIDPMDLNERMFILGSYLLVKGHQTYLNFEVDMLPEWFPEYAIAIGHPVDGIPENISLLWASAWNVYRRNYSNGIVLVNPADAIRTIHLDRTYYQVIPSGGGIVPENGDISGWSLNYRAVNQITLVSNRAVILLERSP